MLLYFRVAQAWVLGGFPQIKHTPTPASQGASIQTNCKVCNFPFYTDSLMIYIQLQFCLHTILVLRMLRGGVFTCAWVFWTYGHDFL